MSPSSLKSFAIALVVAIVLTVFVRGQFGDETFVCTGGDCVGPSGTKSLLTGLAFAGPLIAALGFTWTDWLAGRGRLGPMAKFAIPDFEQIFEVLSVLLAGFISYRLILGGPSIEALDVRQVNQWANDLRNFRAEEFAPTTNLVPSTTTWFLVGAILSGPFWFSFGAMLGREIIGRKSRKAAASAALEYDVPRSTSAAQLRAQNEPVQEINLNDPGGRIDLTQIESGSDEFSGLDD